MNGTKKKVKTLERPLFEINPVTGQKILLPLDFEAIRKEIDDNKSPKQCQSQKKKNHLNGPTFRGKKKESKGVDEIFNGMFDSPKQSQPQTRKSHLNGLIFNERKRDPYDVEETCKSFGIDPVAGHKMLYRVDFEAIRKAVNVEQGLQQQNVKQITSGRKRMYTKESQATHKMFGTDEIPAKLRKKVTPKSVRKGLFSSKFAHNSKTLKKQSSTSGRQSMSKKKPKIVSPRSSPLLNMEEFEDEIINKKRVLKNTSKSKTLDIPEIIVEEFEYDRNSKEDIDYEPKTPDSSDEFKRLEEICMEKYLESPITSISNLMEVTGINSSVKRTKLNFNTNSELKMVVNNVEQLIKDEQARHILLMEEEVTRHEQNMLKLNSVLTSLTNVLGYETGNKENNPVKSSRRSIRLQNKSPLKDSNAKLFISPSFSRSGDLRKSTLKKNLVTKHLDYQSPRTKKAMELYNSMRSVNPVLETPKTERKCLVQTPTSMSSRQMSMKLHSQCLLLQGTPIQK